MQSIHSRTVSYAGLLLLLTGIAGCQDNPTEESAAAAEQAALAVANDEAPKGAQIPFADAEVFFEFNTTDNDLGFQVFLDAEGWDKVDISDPDNQKVVEVNTKGPLSALGITEFRFESAEPSPEEVLALFPPGEYEFSGKTIGGETLMSTAELSHDLLPSFTFSPSGGDEVDPKKTVVSWKAPGAELIEVIIESEETDNIFDVIVACSTSRLNIPPQFLEPGVEYKIELLAYAENGNRTIVESTFVTQEES